MTGEVTDLLGRLLEGARQHPGEELEGDGKQELHEGDDDENEEGDETEEVGRRPHQLDGSSNEGMKGRKGKRRKRSAVVLTNWMGGATRG